ncbi:flavonol synthase/flavanone 3-hydroxylase-like [Diospyros lotus]|uniref:flavonol synthase/flavanone 3-hydroxylase-like n=1 Tax=Diospyros lotus TaxID=55363 RepID=UPI00224EA0B5|nr:flavonol synthase/flavanone 3-hydroxylase-like [Diospyros lotus]
MGVGVDVGAGVGVPVISLSHDKAAVVREISTACSEWGIFLLTDHGIPSLLMQRLREAGQQLFDLPEHHKESLANDPLNAKFEGYGAKMARSLPDDHHDKAVERVHYFFHYIHPPSMVNHRMWPDQHLPSYRGVIEEYKVEILKLTNKLLELLSEGLGLEGKALKWGLVGHEEEEDIGIEMKINMYPPCPRPQPEQALGVEPHTDMSALTLLFPNEVPGLQVWKDSHWLPVHYLPNALFVHVGDQIEVLSNGKYKSVLHKSLVDGERTRMSWAVFVVPPCEATIGPLPELIDRRNPPKYPTKTYADYRYRKLNKLPQ